LLAPQIHRIALIVIGREETSSKGERMREIEKRKEKDNIGFVVLGEHRIESGRIRKQERNTITSGRRRKEKETDSEREGSFVMTG